MTDLDPFRWPLTVPVKPCGCIEGDACSCACEATKTRIELAHVMSDPIVLPPHADLPCLTDRALTGYAPPLRWDVGEDGVTVEVQS